MDTTRADEAPISLRIPEASGDSDGGYAEAMISALQTGSGKQSRFTCYLVGCCFTTFGTSGVAVGVWSSIGCGRPCVLVFEDLGEHAPAAALVSFGLMLVLFLIDFFYPPHLPGRMFMFREDTPSKVVGWLMFLAALAAAFFAGLLYAKFYPVVPLILTVFISPGLCFLVFVLGKLPQAKLGDFGHQDFKQTLNTLMACADVSKDHKHFYQAATYAYFLTGIVCIVSWIVWFVLFREGLPEIDADEAKLVSVIIGAPVIVALSNWVFAGFAAMRALLNEAYFATDMKVNQLIKHATAYAGEGQAQKRMDKLSSCLTEEVSGSPSPKTLARAQDTLQQYLIQHVRHMKRLAETVRLFIFIFCGLFGVLFVTFQLVGFTGPIAFTIQTFFGGFFVTFVFFVALSFRRVWKANRKWFEDHHIWKSLLSISEADWARGLLMTLLLPVVPVILGISVINQCVRRCRGIGSVDPALEQSKDGLGDESLPCSPTAAAAAAVLEHHGVHVKRYRLCFTQRVQNGINTVLTWNWIQVTRWCYIFSVILILYVTVPLILALILAYMNALLKDVTFWWVLAATYLMGMFLFMLPPVPGPPIYIFGGLVIAGRCPWGFTVGNLCCIALSVFLKMSACAVQQELIGGKLGNILYVRQLVGVHHPFMRAVEVVLRRPGLNFGKCMILCGAPDWPVSVLAGILRLSLFQCLLGTCPVMLSVVPMVLTGSFYLKRDESQAWVNAGNLMLSLTGLVSTIFWVGMGWAIQDAFSSHGDEITRAKIEFVELDWLDHKNAVITHRCAVSLGNAPRIVQVLYTGGSILLALVAHGFLWRSHMFFGKAEIGDTSAIKLYGKGALIRPPGAVGLALTVLSLCCYVAYSSWYKRQSSKKAADALVELDAVEISWKEARTREVELTNRPKTQESKVAPTERGPTVDVVEAEPTVEEPRFCGRHRGGDGARNTSCKSTPRDEHGTLRTGVNPATHGPASDTHEQEAGLLFCGRDRGGDGVHDTRCNFAARDKDVTLVNGVKPATIGREPSIFSI